MGKLNEFYNLGSEKPLISSYDYFDVEEGTGVVVFKGYSVGTSTGGGSENENASFHLSRNSVYSNSIVSMQNSQTADFTKIFDHDYDLVFNKPQRLKGTFLISLTMGRDTATSISAYYTAKIRKWDGTTETEIASQDSSLFGTSVAAVDSETKTVRINVSTIQSFKAGDTLRITIEYYAKQTTGSGNYCGYAHDPKDRNDDNVTQKIIEDADTTTMEVHVPFIIRN